MAGTVDGAAAGAAAVGAIVGATDTATSAGADLRVRVAALGFAALQSAVVQSAVVQSAVAAGFMAEVVSTVAAEGSTVEGADMPEVDMAVVAEVTEHNLPGRDYGLSLDQALAIEKIATSGRVLDLLLGPAGSGKSTAMAGLRAVWEASHGKGSVIGLAPSAVAAQVLSDELGIETENTAKWLTEWRRIPELSARRDRLAANLARHAHAEEEVDDGRRVDYGHSPRSRMSRTASSVGSTGWTGPRAAMRAASSAGVGREAARPSTPRTYSERETPDVAARAFSVR